MPEPTAAEIFADFAASFRIEDVPPAIVEKAKLHILDTLGCAIAGAGSDFARASYTALQQLGGGDGSVAIGQAGTLGLRDAVMFNAGIAHMLDFDDTHTTTLNHVSVSAVPLVLALGARERASGADMLAAYLIAAEVNCRIGLAAGGPAFLHRGVHPTGALNGFGASLAAAKLTGLDRERMAHAQGIALSFAAGSMEWQRDGAQAKRLHPGNAAVAGLTAASYAAEGITGPRLPYEGRAGIYRLFLGPDAPIDDDALSGELGTCWAFGDVSIKPFPLVHHVHGIIECALGLVREDGVMPDQIDRISVLVAEPQIPILCEPAQVKRNPANEYQGIFSLYHTVATAIVRGRMTLAETGEDLLHDPEIAALRSRIDYVTDPDSAYPRYYSGGLCVTLKDGRLLERYEPCHPGSDKRPLTAGQVVGKFRDNARRLYDQNHIETLIDTVLGADIDTMPISLAARLGKPS